MFRCELCDEYLNFFRGGCLCENCYDIRTITKCYDSSTILNCLKEHFTVESKFSPKEQKEEEKEAPVEDNKIYGEKVNKLLKKV